MLAINLLIPPLFSGLRLLFSQNRIPLRQTPSVLKTYDHARKLSHVKDYPIGTLSWGSYLIGSRSVESLIKEYEYSLPSLVEENEKRHDTDALYEYSVERIADGLFQHIKAFYDNEFKELPEKPELGVLISGYSSGKFFPEQWLFFLPQSAQLTPVRPDKEGKPEFGAQWFGVTDAIVRLHHGRDDGMIGKLSDRFKVPPEEILEVLKEFEYPVIFHGMPLQDAIDYATYMVNVVVGRFRFVIGAPLCGGEVDVAVITPNTFTWVQRKSWKTNRISLK